MKKLLCKVNIHLDKKIIGTAMFPYDTTKEIVAFGCRTCGKKLKNASIVPRKK